MCHVNNCTYRRNINQLRDIGNCLLNIDNLGMVLASILAFLKPMLSPHLITTDFICIISSRKLPPPHTHTVLEQRMDECSVTSRT